MTKRKDGEAPVAPARERIYVPRHKAFSRAAMEAAGAEVVEYDEADPPAELVEHWRRTGRLPAEG